MENVAVDSKKAAIIAKAWANPEYKKQLIADPKKLIAAEFGVEIPAGVTVKVLADSAETEHLVLVPPDFLPETDQVTPQMVVAYKSWTDPAFKAALLANPRKAVGELLKVTLPDKPALKVVEQTDSSYYIVIPQRPASLSDDELDQVAGGTSTLQKVQYGVGGGSIGVGVAMSFLPGGVLLGAPLVLSGVGALLGDSDIRHGIATGAKAVGQGVSTAAHAVSSVAKKIFHGW